MKLLKTVLFYLAKIVFVIFTLGELPLGVYRMMVVAHRPLPEAIIGFPLLIAALAFDLWMLVVAIHMQEHEFQIRRVAGAQALRTAATIAIILIIDGPIVGPSIRDASINRAFSIMQSGWPAATQSQYYSIEAQREREHFLLDTQPYWLMFKEDPTRSEFYERFVASNLNYSIAGRFQSLDDCRHYVAQAKAVDLQRFPILAHMATRNDALCAALSNDGHRSARLYLAFKQYDTPVSRVNAVFALNDAAQDGANIALPYLQNTLLRSDPRYVHAVCAHYQTPRGGRTLVQQRQARVSQAIYAPLCQAERLHRNTVGGALPFQYFVNDTAG